MRHSILVASVKLEIYVINHDLLRNALRWISCIGGMHVTLGVANLVIELISS